MMVFIFSIQLCLGLAKKSVWVFPEDVWKNLNELFGQANNIDKKDRQDG